MRRKKMDGILLSAFLLVGAPSAHWPAAAQDAKQSYASMAPVEHYLMDRDAEIALARSGRELRVFSFFPAIFFGINAYGSA